MAKSKNKKDPKKVKKDPTMARLLAMKAEPKTAKPLGKKGKGSKTKTPEVTK